MEYEKENKEAVAKINRTLQWGWQVFINRSTKTNSTTKEDCYDCSSLVTKARYIGKGQYCRSELLC